MRFLFSLLFIWGGCIYSQEITIKGKVVDFSTRRGIPKTTISIKDKTVGLTDLNGYFNAAINVTDTVILQFSSPGYKEKKLPIHNGTSVIDLREVSLEQDIFQERNEHLISLTEAELSDDEGSTVQTTGLLQATRDLFLTRAAFDFGQAFFRVRGYDSREGKVFLNGISMNKLIDGRPQWNNWGGLNDVFRNQEFANGLQLSPFGFGGLLGTTNNNLRPSFQRPGTRLSMSFANRTYRGRLMASYSSGLQKNGLAYSFSSSRRWGKQGFIEGTLYDAFSFFAGLEYRWDPKNAISLTGVFAKNRRGRSAAITDEVVALGNRKYNPYWGIQDGTIRNARTRNIQEPLVLLNHFYNSEKLTVTSGIGLQTGKRMRSRLNYFNAPNPDATYYRYLPSFYINSTLGADFTNAALAREGFLKNRQLNWSSLYAANSNPNREGKAAYLLSNDVIEDTQWSIATHASLKANSHLTFYFGSQLQLVSSKNYAKISDLLGASFHEDIDPFSSTRNDIEGPLQKTTDAIFGYNFKLFLNKWNTNFQLEYAQKKWSGFLSGRITKHSFERTGIFKNERFPSTSEGSGEKINFLNFSVKSGITYQFTNRHWFRAHAAYITRAPTAFNSYINPRDTNFLAPEISDELITSCDFNYHFRLPNFSGRLTGLFTRFQNTTDINFFFVDAGVGSDFVQEVISNLDKLHIGLELGLSYEVSPQIKLNLAANLAKYVYANNPNVTINFDTAGTVEDLINITGNIDLGQAKLKNLRLPQGPQRALALGIEYRDPDYWWIGATMNYLDHNYASISAITRTESFNLDPETGAPFPDATPENVFRLLEQKPLDTIYLLNLIGGKSWLRNGRYISLFVSINNLFDTQFRTGGYEQSRNGNFGQLQQDNLRNDPSFAPKYWYGFGRTYFLNLAISF